MSKGFKASERIGKLRRSLGMTQAEFAQRIGVDQTRISQWEAGRGEPSAGTWIKLAALAVKSDPNEAAFFMEQAGFDSYSLVTLTDLLLSTGRAEPGPILATAEAALKARAADQKELAEKGKIILVPPYAEGAWKEPAAKLPPLPLPAEMITNVASTFYLMANKLTYECTATMTKRGFVWGDRIVFDTSGASARKFEPFMYHDVLVNFTGRRQDLVLGPWPVDLFWGRLVVAHDTDASWIGLEPRDDVRHWTGLPSFLVRLASFRREHYMSEEHRAEWLGRGLGSPLGYTPALVSAEKSALSALAVPEGCDIMGRFVALFGVERR